MLYGVRADNQIVLILWLEVAEKLQILTDIKMQCTKAL
jgi:hypothetical protein